MGMACCPVVIHACLLPLLVLLACLITLGFTPAGLCFAPLTTPGLLFPPAKSVGMQRRARVGMQVGQVVETLRACTHQAFPVTPDVVKAYESAEPFDLHGESPLCILRVFCWSI